MISTEKSIVQELHDDHWKARGIRVFVKRDDLIDPVISGNKWRKLKLNIALCRSKRKDGILTFGGAYSNHLVATAAACQKDGLKSIGIVRGDELNADSNDTLRQCAEMGMQLEFVSREEYAMKNDKAYHETLGATYPEYQLVPEGGANYYGMIGCQEIWKEMDVRPDHVFVAQGTTTTSCGVLIGMQEDQKLHVVPVLKGFDSKGEMKTLMYQSGLEPDLVDDLIDGVIVEENAHFGGYGKYDELLIDFMRAFYAKYDLKLDPIYTGKAMFALTEFLKNEECRDMNVLFIHTGGLQGIAGVEKKLGERIY